MDKNNNTEINVNTYSLTECKGIYLYGCLPQGSAVLDACKSHNIRVLGFIDQNYMNYDSYMEYPVYSASDIDTEACVFVLLRSVLQHKRVAKMLLQSRVDRIIYIPTHCASNPTRKLLLKIYNEMLRGDFSNISKIPYCEFGDSSDNQACEGVRIDGNWVTVLTPIETIFSVTSDHLKREVEDDRDLMKDLADKGVFQLQIYWQLYDYLTGKADCLDDYCQYVSKKPDIEKIGHDRKEILDVFEQEICRGMDYFFDGAARGIVRKDSMISIEDGLHRSIYLVYRGFKYVPVTISLDDYNRICKKREVDEFWDWYNQAGMPRSEWPIMHFQFRRVPSRYGNYTYQILKGIQEFFNRDSLPTSILDMDDRSGYFLSVFYALGCRKLCYLCHDEVDREFFAHSINVMGINCECYSGEEQVKTTFDCVIANNMENLSKLDYQNNTKRPKYIIGKTEKIPHYKKVKRLAFVESVSFGIFEYTGEN